MNRYKVNKDGQLYFAEAGIYDEEHQESLEEIFGEPIYTYSRAQAIDDGVLIDVSKQARMVGIKYPTAITSAALGEITKGVEDEADKEDNLFICLFSLAYKARRLAKSASEMRFKIRLFSGYNTREVELKAVCGPGDNYEPVITIMLPAED